MYMPSRRYRSLLQSSCTHSISSSESAAAASTIGNVGGSTPEGEAPYQPWAKALVDKRQADNSKDNPDAHCLPMGIMQLDSHPYPKKIIQAPNELVMIYEASGTTVREIFMDGRPLPKKEDVEPWWNGYSVGHWEGDTLVVDTTNFTEKYSFRGSDRNLHLVEKFTRVDANTINYEFTIDDPTAFTKPWTAQLPMQAIDGLVYEYACHEGNHAMRNILSAARADERAGR